MRTERMWDAVVIGGGPAGALSACLLARVGLKVAVLERTKMPRTKVCGGCLNERGVAVLEANGLGTVLEACGAAPLGAITFHRGRRAVPLSGAFGVAVDRSTFDAALLAEARKAGACVIEDAHARVMPDLTPECRDVALTNQGRRLDSLQARVVIAADGLGSPSLAGLAEHSATVSPRSRLGLGVLTPLSIGAASDYPRGQLHMAIARDGYAGITQLSNGRLCIAAAITPQAARVAPRLGSWIAETLDTCGLPPVPGLERAEVRGTPLLTRRAPRRAGRRLLLVGDAAGYTEPITGEGMAWAFAGAAALPPIVAQGCRQWTPETEYAWEAALSMHVFGRMNVNRWLAAALKRPGWSRAVFSAASLWPGAASAVARKLNQPVKHLRRVA